MENMLDALEISDAILQENIDPIFKNRVEEFYISCLKKVSRFVVATTTNVQLNAIMKERIRQEELKKSGKFAWTCADSGIAHGEKFSVLGEEVGEVAREVVEFKISTDKYELAKMVFPLHRRLYFLHRIRTELIQVAACCVAWCEAIDKEIQILNLEEVKLGPVSE